MISCTVRRNRPCPLPVAFWMGLVVLFPISIVRGADWGPDKDYDMVPVDSRTLAVTLVESGDTEKDLLQQASHRAVSAAAGRLYFQDTVLIATDILRNYLSHQYQKFVISTKVLQKEYVAGKPRYVVKIFIDTEKLGTDLQEKRFLVRPRLQPFFDIYLEEKIEDAEASSPIGHSTIVDILRDEPYVNVHDAGANNTPTNLNILQSPTILRSALINAQKSQVELIVTGAARTRLDRSQELYYTTYYFYTTNVELTLIRVDTGEILSQAKAEKLASAINQQDAASLSVQLAVAAAMNDILDYYRKNWQVLIGHEADYVFMFTGVGEQQLKTLLDTLNGLGEGASAYLKNYWDGVAVVTLAFDGPESRVRQFIKANPYPVLHLIVEDGHKFELRVD